jgi:hypothetical protein
MLFVQVQRLADYERYLGQEARSLIDNECIDSGTVLHRGQLEGDLHRIQELFPGDNLRLHERDVVTTVGRTLNRLIWNSRYHEARYDNIIRASAVHRRGIALTFVENAPTARRTRTNGCITHNASRSKHSHGRLDSLARFFSTSVESASTRVASLVINSYSPSFPRLVRCIIRIQRECAVPIVSLRCPRESGEIEREPFDRVLRVTKRKKRKRKV